MPDAARVDAWRERLAALGPGPYVGISWRSKIQTAERRLEYTRLDEWGEIFAVPGVTWVNLQYDDCNRELRDAEQRFGVQIHRWDWLDLMNDFDEVAALITALDLVVAPFNAVSMLSGALGVRHGRDGQPLRLGRARHRAAAVDAVASRVALADAERGMGRSAGGRRARVSRSPTARDARVTIQGLRRNPCST